MRCESFVALSIFRSKIVSLPGGEITPNHIHSLRINPTGSREFDKFAGMRGVQARKIEDEHRENQHRGPFALAHLDVQVVGPLRRDTPLEKERLAVAARAVPERMERNRVNVSGLIYGRPCTQTCV